MQPPTVPALETLQRLSKNSEPWWYNAVKTLWSITATTTRAVDYTKRLLLSSSALSINGYCTWSVAHTIKSYRRGHWMRNVYLEYDGYNRIFSRGG